MSYGIILHSQEEEVSKAVVGHVVHDLGAGDLELTCRLLDLGAQHVVAVDRVPMGAPWESRVTIKTSEFVDVLDDIDIAFVSWPDNRIDIGLLLLCARAQSVIYIGSNVDGSQCGFPHLFRHLNMRKVIAYMPDPANTICVYGPLQRKVRPPLGEEYAGIHTGKMMSFAQAEGRRIER